MLEIVQDLKALPILLAAQPITFILDLACLASKRGYLKLDKWLSDKLREHQVRSDRVSAIFLPSTFLGVIHPNDHPISSQEGTATVVERRKQLQADQQRGNHQHSANGLADSATFVDQSGLVARDSNDDFHGENSQQLEPNSPGNAAQSVDASLYPAANQRTIAANSTSFPTKYLIFLNCRFLQRAERQP